MTNKVTHRDGGRSENGRGGGIIPPVCFLFRQVYMIFSITYALNCVRANEENAWKTHDQGQILGNHYEACVFISESFHK